ncbi:MAG: chemotaxis family two-component system response regulator PixG [Gammaproteobacteria bacterium]|jgi:chemotaxis family two-component system response regulator PixG
MSEHKPTVVIVDDSSTVRLFFERAVAPLDVDLEMFASANDALKYLDSHKPDLLFLDIIMPEKDGLTFLQELRRLPLHADTPTVVISSKDYAQDRVAAKELGVVEFVAKPMSTKVIEELIVRYTASV